MSATSVTGLLMDSGSFTSYSPIIGASILRESLQKMQEVKIAVQEPVSTERLVVQAKERLRVSIEANAVYSLKQYNDEGKLAIKEAWLRTASALERHTYNWFVSYGIEECLPEIYIVDGKFVVLDSSGKAIY